LLTSLSLLCWVTKCSCVVEFTSPFVILCLSKGGGALIGRNTYTVGLSRIPLDSSPSPRYWEKASSSKRNDQEYVVRASLYTSSLHNSRSAGFCQAPSLGNSSITCSGVRPARSGLSSEELSHLTVSAICCLQGHSGLLAARAPKHTLP
jgi:hypothetical protein